MNKGWTPSVITSTLNTMDIVKGVKEEEMRSGNLSTDSDKPGSLPNYQIF
jgi:hypothetical protein